MGKTETLNLRVAPEFKRKLIEEARRERRSLTNYIEATLATFWQQKGSVKSRRSNPRKERL